MGRRAAGPEAGRKEALSPGRRSEQRAGAEGTGPSSEGVTEPGVLKRQGGGASLKRDDVVLDPLGGWKKSLLRDAV